MQRLLRSSIEVVSPDTLVICEEFGDWEDSRGWIDLLGLDRDANLLVIKLNRGEEGGHTELQAIHYAALSSPWWSAAISGSTRRHELSWLYVLML